MYVHNESIKFFILSNILSNIFIVKIFYDNLFFLKITSEKNNPKNDERLLELYL